MTQIKAIFFDVDSTIYTHRIHDFPKTTKEALWRLKEKGYRVGIATSRCRYETKHLPSFFREFPFDAEIYDGGALVMLKKTLCHKSLLAETAIRRLLAYCEKEKVPLRYSTFDGDWMATECDGRLLDQFFKLYLNYPMKKSYEGEETYNLLAYPEKEEQCATICALMEKDANIVKHTSCILELTAKGVDKSAGVAKVCEAWGISMRETACFGDGANDVEMLKKAGIGIAMGNGHRAAKEAADHVCGHIDEDGLYHMCADLKLI